MQLLKFPSKIVADSPRRARSLPLVLAVCGSILLTCSAVHAQKGGAQAKSSPVASVVFGGGPDIRTSSADRIVQGRVMNDKGEMVKNAAVSLEDSRGKKTVFTDETGNYRFTDVPRNIDYKLWAETDTRKSESKTISSFDDRKSMNVDLKLSASVATAVPDGKKQP